MCDIDSLINGFFTESFPIFIVWLKGATMSIIMNVQYSAFSNNRIEPTPDTVNSILAGLNSLGKYVFIPSMIAGQNIDLLAGKVNPVNNISFVTIDQQVQIACILPFQRPPIPARCRCSIIHVLLPRFSFFHMYSAA